MTAPLPPLPVENFVDKDGLWDEKYGPYSADEMQSYAKLALREALERAAICAWSTGMDEHNKAAGLPCDARTTGSRCAEAIRAMIEELGK